ncbi:MAG TPA: cupin domain-containing protein [Anaerolineales bacterium]|nr:cupin domain-containing protein [Anaerolineales bacterium]
MDYFKDFRQFAGFNPEKFFKSTLFQSQSLLLGLNCFEPGQVQEAHTHADQDKFYFVLDGEGEFSVGAVQHRLATGQMAWAPAGEPHGVRNTGLQRLVVLVGIAPAPG